MEWWMPYAVFAAALAASIVVPQPRPRRRSADWAESEEIAPGHAAPNQGASNQGASNQAASGRISSARRKFTFDDLDDEPEPAEEARPARRARPERRRPAAAAVDLDEAPGVERAGVERAGAERPGGERAAREPEPDRRATAKAARRSKPSVRGGLNGGVNGGAPGRHTPVAEQPSYFRDPGALEDWPQKEVVEDTVRVFLDRWGGDKALTTFRQVEVAPGSNERAFVFLLAVEPERRGKETAILARVSVPGENADLPCRFKATKYFDHMGERFREDVAKTPQHSRGVITVRDVPAGEDGRGAVALDYEAPLRGDLYDDIRSDDVAQYKNLLNILRMFA